MTPFGTSSISLRVLLLVVAVIATSSPAAASAAPAAADRACGERLVTLEGTAGDDVLVGTPGDDVIDGRDGDDEIRSRGGNDVVCGRRGNDKVYGGSNADLLLGGPGSDLLLGEDGRDLARGQDGDDYLIGGDGEDELLGGEGDDLASGGADRDDCRAETMWSCNEEPANSAPVARNDAYALDEDGSLDVPAPGVLGNDTDADGDVIGAIQVTSPAHGTVIFSDNGSFTYTPDSNFHGTDSFNYVAHDGNAESAPATVTLTVSSVNDPVTDLALSNSTVAENRPAGETVGTLSATDADHSSHTFTLVAGEGDGDNASFTIDGTTVKTAGPLDAETDSPLSIRVQASDGGGSTRSEIFEITVTQGNDAPVITAPASESTDEDTQQVFSQANSNAISVADQDAGTNHVTAALSVAHGTLTLGGTTGLTFVEGDGTGDADMMFTGTVADINAALEGLTYTPESNYAGADSLDVSINDGGHSDGDLKDDVASVALTVDAINDGPVNSVPGAQTVPEDGQETFSETNNNVISISDVDADGDAVQITLSVEHGVLTLAGTEGLTPVTGDGTNDATMTYTGSVADINAALEGLSYSPESNFDGTDTLTIVTDDQGNNGAGGALTDTDTVTLNITAANDAPIVNTSGGSTAYTEGDPATVIDDGVTVIEPDDPEIQGGQVSISTGFQSGDSLVFVDMLGISGVYNSGTGVLTLTGAASEGEYQAALRSIEFSTTNDDPSSSKTVEFTVNDGDATSSAATKAIEITRVNDAPMLTTTATDLAYTEGDGAKPVDGGVTLTDPDSTQIQGATIQITGNYVSTEDELAFVNTSNITGSFNATTATLTLSGSDTVAGYQSALRSVTYENVSDSSGTKTIEFQVTDAGGAASNVATRDIAVTGANDAPVVTTSGGSTSYTEGGSATPVDGAVTVTDVDDANLEGGQVRISEGFDSGDDLVFINQNGISGSYNTATGLLTLTGTAPTANYQTALRSVQFSTTSDAPTSPKTVEFSVSDGDLSTVATKVIEITAADDAPMLTASGGTTSFVEDTSGPVAVDPALLLSDPDTAQMSSAYVFFDGAFDNSEDELLFTPTELISGSYNTVTGELLLTGTDTVANYQAALRSVEYNNTDTVSPSTATRTVGFNISDPDGALSNTVFKDVTVSSVNDAPVVTTTADSTAYTEDGPAATVDSGLTISDQDDTNLEGGQVRLSSGFQSGDDLVFVNQYGISGNYSSGTGVLTLSGTASVADYQSALQSIQFQTTNQQPVPSKTVEFKVNDGDVNSNLATKDLAVTSTNDGPVVTSGGTLSYTENDPATAVHSGLTIDDLEDDNLSGGSASITANYQAGQDDLSWTDNNLADNVTLDGVNSTDQTIVLTGIDTEANYQAALRAVTYQNGSESPSTVNRTVTISATDQPGLTGSDTRTIAVTGVDDSPTAVDDSVTVSEDSGANAIDVLANDTDGDGGPKTISSVFQPTNGTVVLTGGSSGAHTGLTYQPNANFCGAETFTYTVNGGSIAMISIDITCVNDAPSADAEIFGGTGNLNDQAHGNTTMQVDDPTDDKAAPTNPHTEITGDILDGDTDADGPGPIIVQSAGSDTGATNGQSQDGGTVTIESDGDFVYQPPAVVSCDNGTDSFNYKISDQQNSGSGPIPGTAIGTVTIHLEGCVWYVNNNAAGNAGTASQPFDTLVNAETASGANHTVFVFDGDNSPVGYDAAGYQMNSGERLIGEHEGLTVDPDQGGALTADTLHPANPGAHPTLTSTGANADVVDLDDGNEIRGLNIDPQTGHGGIQGSTGDTGGGTIDDVNIVDTFGTNGTQAGLELSGTTGTFNISNFTTNQNNAPGVLLANAANVDFAGDTSVVTLQTNGAKALDAFGASMNTSSFDAVVATNSASGGVAMTNTPGTTVFGDGAGTDLSLTTTSGSQAAFGLTNAGTVVVASAGTDEVHATGGPAVDVVGTSGAQLEFDDVDSTNSSTDGINLDSLGAGTFSAATGDVTGAAGISFDLNGGSGSITYPGNLGDGSGTTAIDITGRSGGVISLSGSISDTNDAGGAVNVSGNTGGSTVLSGATKQFNTGATDAVSLTSSDGHTFVLSGGGTDIDTTSGNGLVATSSGTVQVSGSGNTIDATALGASNRGLNITDTDIAAADVTFQRITTSGGASGIQLSTTSIVGNLNVTGNGGTCTNADTSGCSGGTIANTTGADDVGLTPAGSGIVLNSTVAPSFTRMWIHDHTNYGIRGNNVTGFALTNSVVNATGANGNNVATDEGSVSFDELVGSATITDSVIMQGFENDLRLRNDSGNLNRLTVSGSRFGSSSTSHNDSIQIEGNANSILNATVQNSTFTGARGDQFQAVIQDNATGDIQFTGNTITNAHTGSVGGGVLVAAAGNGDMTYALNGNNINGAKGSALVAEKLFGPGTNDGILIGTISNNTIGTAGVASSGSENGSGIFLRELGRGRHSVQVINNTLRGYRDHGIAMFAGGAPTSSTGLPAHDGDLNLTITGNNVAQPNGTGAGTGGGIYLQAGTNSPDMYDVCVNANNNTINGSAPLALGSTDFLMFQRFDTKFLLPGYTGVADGTVTGDLNSYFHPRFVGGVTALGGNTTTQYIVNTASATGGYFNSAGGFLCPTS